MHSVASLDYSDGVRDHFFNPRNAGPLAGATHIGTAGDPGRGPFVKLFIRLDGGTVADIAFQTYGCAAAIASCSKLTEMVKGKTIKEALAITPDALLAALGGLPLGKRHCPGLAVDALANALAALGKDST
jgi:NifU-like protein involved in Fe-S cluster formation